MQLARGWWKRWGAAKEIAPNSVVLDWYAVDLEAVCEHGTYYVERAGPDWTARFRPLHGPPCARDICVDSRHADGGTADWVTRGCAEEACRLHAHLLGLGYSVRRATELVAARSQRVEQHQHVVLDYASPITADQLNQPPPEEAPGKAGA